MKRRNSIDKTKNIDIVNVLFDNHDGLTVGCIPLSEGSGVESTVKTTKLCLWAAK